jgi:hypothetical protein
MTVLRVTPWRESRPILYFFKILVLVNIKQVILEFCNSANSDLDKKVALVIAYYFVLASLGRSSLRLEFSLGGQTKNNLPKSKVLWPHQSGLFSTFHPSTFQLPRVF